MAVLLSVAIGEAMATPSPTGAAADEFSAFMSALDPRPGPALSRLSFQPRELIQTPVSATDSPPAAAGDAAPHVALTSAASPLPMPDLISMQAEIDRMAIQAAMQAAMQVQADELKAQAAELKYQALAMQMKEAAHTADMARAAQEMRELKLEMRLQNAHAETALANERAASAAAMAMLTRTATVPPDPIKVEASTAQVKFIGLQLVPFSTESFTKANSIRPGVTAEAISGIALALLNTLTAVQGQEHYAIMIGWMLNLSLQHDVSSAGGSARVIVRNITATLAGEADGISGTDDDSVSTLDSSSSASDSPSPPRYDTFDGKGAARKRKAFHALLAILGGVGDIVHTCMVHWAAIDRALLAILKLLVPKTASIMFKAVQRQSSFIGGLQIVLFQIGHGVKSHLVDCFDVITQPISYANEAGTFDDVTIADAMHTLIGDFQGRMAAFETVKDHAPQFCLSQAMKSFPTAEDGSLAGVIHDLERDIRKADVSSSSEALVDTILAAIQGIGTTELTGTMQVAVPKQRPKGAVSHAAEKAASTIQIGGKGGKGVSNGKGKGKGTGDHQPRCQQGSKCKNYGTLTGCPDKHEDADIAEMQVALGDNFVSRAMRMKILAYMANQPAAVAASTGHSVQPPLSPVAPQPPVPEPALSAVAAKAAKLEKAAGFLASLKKAQREYDESGTQQAEPQHSGAAMSAPHFALSSLPIMQSRVSSDTISSTPTPLPNGNVINGSDALSLTAQPLRTSAAMVRPEEPPVVSGREAIQPILANDQQRSMAYDMLLAENARLRNVITMLAACGHHAMPSADLSHAVPSLPSSPLYEQPVGDATSLMPAACTDSVDMPAQTIGDFNTIIMPPIVAAALTPSIPTIHMATGPQRTMCTHHVSSRSEWTGSTIPTTMGVSRTVLEQARIESAARMAASNERMQPHCFQCPHSLLRHTAEGARSSRCGNGKCPCRRNRCTGT